MRIPVIAANWKMHKTAAETAEFIERFLPLVKDVTGVEIIIAPPFTSLHVARAGLDGSAVRLAAQNIYFEKKGAYTGEVSADMVVDAGCSHVIIGHSERRQYFGESDEMLNRKVSAALDAGLEVIFCVGETLQEREAGKTSDVVGRELEKGLDGTDLSRVIIAYEPVWAIGTGRTATPEMAQEVHAFIRTRLGDRSGVRILYGGSVKPGNIRSLMEMEDIDGALVGGASLDPESFSQIVRFK